MIRLFRVFVPVGTLALLISEILLVTGAFVLASYITSAGDPGDYLLYDGGWQSILRIVLIILIGLYLHDLYSDIYVKSRIILVQQLCLVMGMAFLMQGLISYVDPSLRIPLREMTLGSSLAMGAIYGWRNLFSTYVIRVVGRDRLLLVGDSPVLVDIARFIDRHPEKGLVVAGFVGDLHDQGEPLPGGKLLGPVAALREIVDATRPSRIVVGMFERRNCMPVNELLELRFEGNIIEEAASAYERVCGRVCVKELRPSQLIYSGELGPRRQTLLYQSLWNILVAGIGAILTSPLMLMVALAVRLSSPGPVLYRQARIGMGGAPFTLYKFRSMRVDAEAETGAVWASKDDPRVTAVGRIIRGFRLDEMPQFFNVLKGEMSIVGPRPERPEFVKALSSQIPYYPQRHCVRPGITGWAQISYRYGETLEDTIEKLEYDLFYIKNMSLGLDTYIIFHTLKTMLLSRGAQ
ncbi:MAG: sugar transferase [Acidobacteriia bacterium]|nr:sugar transferase [Terriglobia bacterium]